MTTDWHGWHREYDDPASSLSRRLAVVRKQLTTALDARVGRPTRLLSLCSGDGRDTLPVLAGRDDVIATLVELDEDLGRHAREDARALGLDVDIRVADAGTTESFADVLPVDVLMLCGVLGNISDADTTRTIRALPSLLAPDAVVIWTRGTKVRNDASVLPGDPSEYVRLVFADAGFSAADYVRPTDAGYRVGVSRLAVPPRQSEPGVRLFRFVR